MFQSEYLLVFGVFLRFVEFDRYDSQRQIDEKECAYEYHYYEEQAQNKVHRLHDVFHDR